MAWQPNASDFVPASADWALRIAASDAFASDELWPLLDLLVPADRRQTLDTHFGFRPEDVRTLVFASVDGAPFVLIHANSDVLANAQAIAARMNTIETESDAPLFRRQGFIGTERREVAVLAPRLLLYAGPSPAVLRVLRAAAERRSVESPFTWNAGVPREATMFSACTSNLQLPPGAPIATVLSDVRHTCLHGKPEAGGLHLWAGMSGRFPQTAPENVRRFLRLLGGSDVGRMLGGRDAAASLRVEGAPEALQIEVIWPISPLVSGLRAIVSDDWASILGP
ncbi:MAG: hypothetical protein AAF938_08475 [Myxococcota bacterium]